jgi:hypothetical protein
MSEAVKDQAKAEATGGSLPTKTLYCSFCFKSQHEVKKLISGPGSIFICDECVGLCNEIIADRPLNSKSRFYHRPRPDPAEELELLERLDRIFNPRQSLAAADRAYLEREVRRTPGCR